MPYHDGIATDKTGHDVVDWLYNAGNPITLTNWLQERNGRYSELFISKTDEDGSVTYWKNSNKEFKYGDYLLYNHKSKEFSSCSLVEFYKNYKPIESTQNFKDIKSRTYPSC